VWSLGPLNSSSELSQQVEGILNRGGFAGERLSVLCKNLKLADLHLGF
jgi:hypothetical protein